LIDGEVRELLEAFGAVEIDGAKWCGKTWLALNHACSAIHLDDDEAQALTNADPKLALQGAQPRLIDEWQEVPKVRDAIRRAVDASGSKPGAFLLTGSSTPTDIDAIHHSGAGRMAFLHLRPLSLFEAGVSDGSVSLGGLFDGVFEGGQKDTGLDVIAEEICRGGWPAGRNLPLDRALRIPGQYMKSVYGFSAPKLKKSGATAARVFAALARTTGDAASYATLVSDISEGEHASARNGAGKSTVEEYLDFFKRLYLVEELLGWDAPVRSRARVRTRPKRYVVDPSLAANELGLSPEALLRDMQTFGKLFECLCIRDIRVYLSACAETADAKLRYYLDDYGLEVDAIVELSDGRWGGIEIKLSEDKVEEGVANLLRLKAKVDGNGMARAVAPSFLAVLVGRTSFARKTPDGVYVIPITSLTL
jgi:predicted AAA+ superfamily ATPase